MKEVICEGLFPILGRVWNEHEEDDASTTLCLSKRNKEVEVRSIDLTRVNY
jgi:hypothetical protein